LYLECKVVQIAFLLIKHEIQKPLKGTDHILLNFLVLALSNEDLSVVRNHQGKFLPEFAWISLVFFQLVEFELVFFTQNQFLLSFGVSRNEVVDCEFTKFSHFELLFVDFVN
jgi:hypothetical protein